MCLTIASAGCQGEAGLPPDGSPIVAAGSDAYKKALAETEQKIKADEAAEAKARGRMRVAPAVE